MVLMPLIRVSGMAFLTTVATNPDAPQNDQFGFGDDRFFMPRPVGSINFNTTPCHTRIQMSTFQPFRDVRF
ncbi:hypothetical protein BSFP_065980 [Burkholderia stabilis]|uniref:Uncharacterized protein n=1 Tax=Burkholderia stabilis TaxID=95485 RepID=A0A1Y1BVC2_9BURK|nr:hypothetical protein BSFP_065980 [Burkholderia stabilis]